MDAVVNGPRQDVVPWTTYFALIQNFPVLVKVLRAHALAGLVIEHSREEARCLGMVSGHPGDAVPPRSPQKSRRINRRGVASHLQPPHCSIGALIPLSIRIAC